MAISRPFLLALLGAVLAAATLFTVTRSRDEASTDSGSPAAEKSQQPDAGAQSASMSADEALAGAFKWPEVRSGKLDLSVHIKELDGDHEVLNASVDGRFQSRGATDVPEFDLRLMLGDGASRLATGAISTGNAAYLVSGNKTYKVPAPVWARLSPARAKISEFAKSSSAGAASSAPAAAQPSVDPKSWLSKVEDRGTETVDGVETKHVSASVDAKRVAGDLVKFVRAGGLQAQIPPGLVNAVDKWVQRADVDVWVGQDDRIMRRLSIAADLNVSREDVDDPQDVGRATIRFDVQLSDVNKPQRIDPPADVQREPVQTMGPQAGTLASNLLVVGVLAVDPPPGYAEALRAGYRFDNPASTLRGAGNPQRLRRALNDHRKVVLFFGQGGLDDQATAAAVRDLDRRTNVLVLTDRVENTDRYGKLVEELGVNQAPAVVIFGRDGKARLFEGYIEAGTLRQEVADTR
jgi:hypothetical protein